MSVPRLDHHTGAGLAMLFSDPLLERRLIEALPLGVVVLDEEYRYVLVNEKGAALNGFPAAEHPGRKASEVVPDAFPLVEPYYRQVFDTGESVEGSRFQAQTSASPGDLRWWATSYFPLLDENGRVYRVCAIFNDVTAQVESEARLKQTTHELETLLDVAPVALAITRDQECSEVQMNGAFKRMVGLPPDAGPRDWASSYAPDNRLIDGMAVKRSDLPIRRAAAGEPTEACRMDVIRPDGSSVVWRAQAVPLVIDGENRGAVAAYVDITELTRVADQLRAANRIKDDFLAMVSHELRTPLTVILGDAQLLSRSSMTLSSEQRFSLAEDIYRESVGLTRIVENLLLMTRLDRGDPVELEPVILKRLYAKVVSDSSVLAARRASVSFPDFDTVVLGNETSIEQVMRNFLSNAIKYSPADSPIEVSVYETDGEMVFSVADRGQGIDAQDCDRIFEPFFRAESAQNRSGMGIGLAVCKRLVESMQGRIWAEPREDGGSTFSFAVAKLASVEA